MALGVALVGNDLAAQGNLVPASNDGTRPEHGTLVPGGFYSFAFDVFAYSDLERISTVKGTGAYVWTIGLEPSSDPDRFGPSPFGLAFDVDGTMYTTINWVSFDPSRVESWFARVDSLTGEVTYIGNPVPFNTSGPDIDARGNMFVCGFQVDALGYIWGNSNLYRIDKTSGEFIVVGDTGHTNWMDLAFDSAGTLWGTFDNELYTIDPQTGTSNFITAISGVPNAGAPDHMEVMSIAFDKHDNLFGTAMTTWYEDPQGSPVMQIDVNTGEGTLVGYTQLPYNHGGDIMPSRVRIAHLDDEGQYACIDVGLGSLPAHMAHGDYVPGTAGSPDACPDAEAVGMWTGQRVARPARRAN